ncbi:MAG: AraC family transcriptional regulator [Parvibaculum sp.]|nr:AraC family transcriptional regulator [Parvibaculum sp.]|tara:strand:- start:413 stop:1396 length:984 start_codon:yes stop_codon:yes gene_type:complete
MTEELSPPLTLRFSSDDYPEKDRAGVFCELVGRAILSFETEALPGEPFYNDGAVTLLPGLAIATANCSGGLFTRTRELAKRSDDIVLAAFTSGRIFVDQRKSEFTVGNGGGYIQLADETMTTALIPGELVRCIQVQIPRKALASTVGDLDFAPGQPVAGAGDALQLLVSYVEGIQKLAGPVSAEFEARIASHVYDLTALAVGVTGDVADQARRRGLRAARLRNIKVYIAANIGPYPLTLEQTAREQGISPVYVRKLFEGEGTNFSAFVLEQRLVRANAIIANPRLAHMAISTIAYDVGFNDLSYFNRAFRKRYGATPSDVRAASLGK